MVIANLVVVVTPSISIIYIYNKIYKNMELHKIRFYSINIKKIQVDKIFTFLSLLQIKLLEIFLAQNIMHLK